MVYDTLDNFELYIGLSERIKTALHYLVKTDLENTDIGTYKLDGDSVFAMVQEYQTKNKNGVKAEAHTNHIDVQYIVSGSEKIGVSLKGNNTPVIQKPKDDYDLYDCESSFISMKAGMFMILFPDDLHTPCINFSDASEHVKKVVIKVRID